MRVVLLQTPPWRPDMPALGLPYIQGALRAAGADVRLHDLNLALYERLAPAEREFWDPSHHFVWYDELGKGRAAAIFSREAGFIDGLLGAAVGAGPVIVGLTALATQKLPALHIAARVKALNPEARVMIGGASCFPQYVPREIVRHPAVDYVVVGEGEYAVVDLVRHIEEGEEGPPPAGVLRCRGTAEGDVESGPSRPLDANLDRLPLPDFTGLPLDRYLDRGRIPILLSRGCVNRCAFCIERKIWERFRFRGAAHIFREITEDVARWGAVKLEVNDSLFNGSIRVLDELCGLLIAAGIALPWGGEGIIRREMTPALLAKLKAAGCGFITYGLESASQKVLDLMRKSTDLAVAARVLRDTHDAGIGVKVNIMVGFPGETEEDFRQTLDFLAANRPSIDEVNPSDGFTGIFPGTDLYERAAEFGVVFVNHHYFWETADGHNTLKVRAERFERVLRHAAALGLACTYRHPGLLDRDKILGDIHLNRKEYADALRHYEAHAAKTGLSEEQIPGYADTKRRA